MQNRRIKMPNEKTYQVLQDGQLAVATTPVEGQIISGRRDQNVTALVSTSEGNQLAIATLPVEGQIISERGEQTVTALVETSNGKQLALKTVSLGESGGGSTDSGEYLVQVIDYDGTVLKEARLNEGETFNLPTPPTNHPRLTFQTWSSSAPIVDNKVTVTNNDILIGPIYDTVSGLTEFDIYVPPSSVGVSGRFAVNGTKDWGDGTSDTAGSHTYSQSGFYTIKVDCTQFGQGAYNGIFVGYDYETPVFRCIGVHCSSNVVAIGSYPLTKTWAKFFTMSTGLTTINEYLNVTTGAITCLILPPNITSLPNNFLRNIWFQKVVLPYGLTTIGDNSLMNTKITFMPIPDTCQNFGSYCLDANYMTRIKIPEGVTIIPVVRSNVPYEFIAPNSATKATDFFNTPLYRFVAGEDFAEIGDGTFSNTRIVEMDFSKCKQIPTLASTNMDKGAVIKVPAALYDQWITETNWVDLADYIVAV